MIAENQNRIDVSFDGSSIITKTINGTTSSTPISNRIVDNTSLTYNADIFRTELGVSVAELGVIQSYMMLRTICDIRKDAINATIAVCDKNYLTNILKQIFRGDLVDNASLQKLEEIKAVSYDNCRNDISGRVFIKSAYTYHIPIPVQYVFNESGAKPDTFSPEGARIMSSFASVADPATRTDPTHCFPKQNVELHFHDSFMKLVGFLETTSWSATRTSEFVTNNSNNTEYTFSINVGNDGGIVSRDGVTNSDIAITPFSGDTGYYFQGNPTKNKFINSNPTLTGDKLVEILRYMIIKEMGDMMQVYVMLVWFYLKKRKNPQMTKDKFVMSTTDLVVMNTCQLFQMPCLYTNQGKDNSMLTGEDKTNLENIFAKKILAKENGSEAYKNWKKNNKFANTLYYLPIEESDLLKKRRRLKTIYYVISTQNKKQLDIFTSASIGNYRYIKMGRLGPLMTSFSSDDIIREIRRKIIENISNINHNLLVEYNRLKNRLIYYPNDYKGDVTDTYLKIHYSLNILITRQKYPPGSNTYVYVIQNLTHYTDQEIICNTATEYCKEDDNGKLVNMILHTISDTNTGNGKFRKFRDILKTTGGNVTPPPDLRVTFPENPKVSGPGPNENWLIYSIANWFNNITDKLNKKFGDVFKPFDFDFLGDLNNFGYWMGVGGTNHLYKNENEVVEGTSKGTNSFGQQYINIGFVTMIPCIYEQLCSIYEKLNVVCNDNLKERHHNFGETFIFNFILNLTCYYPDKEGRPVLLSPYNYVERFNLSNPSDNLQTPIFNLTGWFTSQHKSYLPYEKQVIHTHDIDIEIEKIKNTDDELKERILGQRILTLISNNNTDNNVFTVNDDFAGKLIYMSGLTFNDNEANTPTSNGAEGAAQGVNVVHSTPILTREELTNVPSNIITPLKKNIKKLQNTQGRKELQQKIQELERIDFDNMNNHSLDLLFKILNNINNEITANTLKSLDENLKKSIKEFLIKENKIPLQVTSDIIDDDIIMDDDSIDGGKIIKNKKTRRRMGRTRHKKHHKTNKKHKKHQTSGKNKTRKSKKAKRKNKTR
jgi:hypothetical protein